MFPPWEITSRHVAFSNIGVTMSHEFISTVWNPDCIYPVASFIYLLGCFIYMYFKPYILRKKKKTISTPHQTIPSPSFPSFVSKTIFYSVAQARKLDSPWIPGFFSELICCNPAANMVSSTFKIQLKSHHYFSSPQPPHPTSLLLSLHWPSA